MPPNDPAGAGADAFQEGDDVCAMPDMERGGYAEHVIVEQGQAALKPASLDFVAAAAVPLASLTGWQGLFRHGGLKAEQRVLIHGGSAASATWRSSSLRPRAHM